ncbi:hypothetical protein [Xylophilus sp.]|uniref:hypothetical protein n=1 Tax=Xylophilus sp. TaxID=2653893 RepID=UPI0013BB4FD1|nr:hypothetical protein [Xylophilus sp.]KAF1045341.1 MAG: hypothetical protein GAK38_03053 [Xylophilus sp.]
MTHPIRRVPYRTWPGTLAVLLAIAAYVGGLVFWDRHTPGDWALPAGRTVEIGQVRFVPADGWRMDVSRSRPGRTLVLFKTSHRFVVTLGEWAGGPDGPVVRQRRLMERGQGLRIEGEPSAFFNAWGLEGSTFAYYGSRRNGRFWQVVDLRRRLLAQIDCYGPGDGLDEALMDARRMVDSMDIGAPA